MRTLLLLSIATGAVLVGDPVHAAQDRAAEAAAAAKEAVDAAGGKPAPAPVAVPTPVAAPAPVVVAVPAPAHGVTYDSETQLETRAIAPAPVVRTERRIIHGAAPVEAEYRTLAEGDARGEWLCTQDSPDAREYRCRFDGDMNRARHADGAWRDMDDYDWSEAEWAEEEAYRRDLERACRPDNGIGGSVLGGLLGGFAGNRIAGRGNRTAGTLLGGALGAVAGGLIDQAEDKRRCRDMVSRVEERQRSWAGGRSGYWQQGYGYGWYSPGYVLTTVTSAPVVTETITTTTHYENVPVRKRHAPKKRHYKPKPKPRCTC